MWARTQLTENPQPRPIDLVIYRCSHLESQVKRLKEDMEYMKTEFKKIMELIEKCNVEDRSLLRKREREIMEQTEKATNLRTAYLSEEEKFENHKKTVKKYHDSPAGKLSLTKAGHRQKIKKLQAKIDDQNNLTSEEIADIIYMLEILREKVLSKI
jgi:hypothetical protein